MPAEYTGISWPEEEQPQSLNHRSSAWGLGPLCSSLEVAHRRSFSPGSLFLPKRGDREPGPAPGLSTLLGSSRPLPTSLLPFSCLSRPRHLLRSETGSLSGAASSPPPRPPNRAGDPTWLCLGAPARRGPAVRTAVSPRRLGSVEKHSRP